MRDEVRTAFVERVKAIDPLFKRGDLRRFWPALRDLVGIAPDRVDLSKKKSHYLASLAARSLLRNEPEASLEFLDLADEALRPSHLTPFLLEERREFRRQAEEALGRRMRAPAKGLTRAEARGRVGRPRGRRGSRGP